jgi:hypothetical protein
MATDRSTVVLGWSTAQVAHALAVGVIIWVAWFVTVLWADYITTIVSSMIFAQALYLPRCALQQRLDAGVTDHKPAIVGREDGGGPSAIDDQIKDLVAKLKRLALDLWENPLLFLACLLVWPMLWEAIRQLWRTLLGCGAIFAFTYTAFGYASRAGSWLQKSVVARWPRLSLPARPWAWLHSAAAQTLAVVPEQHLTMVRAMSERAARILSTPPKKESHMWSAADGARGPGPLRPPPPRPPSGEVVSARYAAKLLLTSAVLLVTLNSSLLLVSSVRDVIDLARDSATTTTCAFDASGARNSTASAALAAQARVPQIVRWAGEKLGEQRRKDFCWPAIELLLTRSANEARNESVGDIVDGALQEMHACYPNARRFLDLVAPPLSQPSGQCGVRRRWWRLDVRRRHAACDATADSKGALRVLLEYIVADDQAGFIRQYHCCPHIRGRYGKRRCAVSDGALLV